MTLPAYVNTISVVLAAYLLGSVSTGYWLVKLRCGKDIRQHGSGSTGARNVKRILGNSGFMVTLLGDFLKGACVIAGAKFFELDSVLISCLAVAVICGHVWPVFLGFNGGKGIATALGVLSVYSYPVLLAALVITVLLYLVFRNFTLSWSVSVIFLPFYALLAGESFPVVITCALIAAIVLYAHRSNLTNGTSLFNFRR